MTTTLVIDPSRWDGDHVTPDKDSIHYVRNVLRLTEGDEIFVADGRGNRFRATIETLGRSQCLLRVVEPLAIRTESPLSISCYQALPRSKTMDILVQKLTELGVHHIHPLLTSRSFHPETAAVGEKWQKRWQKIALEATRQCGRSVVPIVSSPRPLARALREDSCGESRGLMFWEGGGRPVKEVLATMTDCGAVTVLVGPEGGFSASEVTQSKEACFEPVSCGPRILRVETAAIVAVTLVQFSRGDLGG